MAASKVTFKVQGVAETNICHFRRCHITKYASFPNQAGQSPGLCSLRPTLPLSHYRMSPPAPHIATLVSSVRNTVLWAVTVHKSVLAQVSDLFYFSEIEEDFPAHSLLISDFV